MHDLIIDIGGTKTKIFIVKNQKTIKSIYFDSTPSILQDLNNHFNKILKEYSISKIRYSVAGQIKEGKVIKSPNIKALNNTDLIKYTFEVTGINDVAVLNDANCFAYGAYLLSGKNYDPFVGIVWGTGIGSGIVINGKILEGKNGLSGELGHIKLSHNYQCGCGKKGCLEAAIGGKYLEKRLNINAKYLLNNRYNLFINKTITSLAFSLEKVIHLLNPEAIYFGGSIGENISPHYFNLLTQHIKKLLSFESDFIISKADTFNAVVKGCVNYK